MENRSLNKKQRRFALLAGALAGLANGLFGAGGGLLLIPLLTGCCGLEQRQALATSVAVTLPLSALSALIYWLRDGLPLPAALPFALGGALGGFLAGKLMGRLPEKLLRRIFALFLLYGALRAWL